MSYSNIGTNLPKKLPKYQYVDPRVAGFARHHKENLTVCEKLLWEQIKDRRLVFEFERQVVILGSIADFVCQKLGLILEVDGSEHRIEPEKKRDEKLLSAGYHTIHFTNSEVQINMEAVIKEIEASLYLLSIKNKEVLLKRYRRWNTKPIEGFYKVDWVW